MKRMLFNATQQEELRVAIVNGQKLIDIDIETNGREQRKSNIYKGVITRIEPSLEACFVNYGEERHGFLPFKEVARSYFKEGVDVRNVSIKDALREGQEIMVQVEKEERGNKGAALTSFVSLAGRYLVLMPNNPRGGGVSRRVEGEDRQELRETMDKLDLPSGMSVIARTAGIGRNVDELQWDLNYLMQLWRAIEGAGQSANGAFLIYQESSLVIRAIRDYFQPDIGEILIDTDDIHNQAQQFMAHVMPDMVHRVKRYRDDVPLFSRFQIEHQIETAYSRTVPLPSGGSIVIDHTEALVSVDVNSARATRGSDIETTAFNTNLEAAEEVARQLRLRDLGGLIVIDFIDMEHAKNQREVETRLKDALHYDRARVQMGKISRFGLMELSRQRLRPSLSEGSHVTCPRCNGTGHIRDTESSALQVLRIIQEEAMKENSAAIHVQVPVDVAAFLLNEKRGEILKIETRHRVSIILIPNKHLETPHYKLERLKHDDPRLEEIHASYTMAEQADTDIGYNTRQKEEGKPRQEAVVKGITPDQPAPIVERKPVASHPNAISPASGIAKESFLSKILGFFRKKPVSSTVVPVVSTPHHRERADRHNDHNGRGQRSRNRHGRNRDRNEERETNAPIREEISKKPVLEVTETKQRQPRPSRDTHEHHKNEARADNRRDRNERPPREEHSNGGTKIDEKLLNGTTFVAVNNAITTTAEIPATVINTHQMDTPRTEDEENDQGEEPRRRRRRGGRNRNRRERDNNSENTMANLQQGDTVNTVETIEIAMTSVQTAEPALTPSHDATVMQSAVPPTVEALAASVPSTTALLIPQQVEAEISTDMVSTPVPVITSTAAIVEPTVIAPVIIETAIPIETTIPTSTVVETTSIIVTPPPAMIAPVTTVISHPFEELQNVLASAGLTLAATDPAKLRAAQEAASQVIPPPRIPRKRKPLPTPSNEPLVQVETQRP